MAADDENTAPEWAHVHFDVACARCGHDLHGQTEPTCPSCKLEFDWAVAVPVHSLICESCDYHLYGLTETRCPECGSEFTWEGALDHFRLSQNPLFEYRWRDEPIRSLVRTWLWALWPPKIWSTVDIHDPPQVRPLFSMLGLCAVSIFMINVLIPTILGCVGGFNVLKSGGWSDGLLLVWQDLILYASFSDTHAICAGVAVWVVMSLGALAVFPQSMSRCRVRYIHVLRVWVYATPMFLPLYIAGLGAAVVLLQSAPNSLDVFESFLTGIGVCVLPFAHVVWSTWWAYKKYIRMRHSFWVAVSAQAMAVLATFTIYIVLRYEFGLL